MSLLRLSDEGVDEALGAALDRSVRMADLHRDLSDVLSAGSVLRRDEPMARRTTLRVGGPADMYLEPATEADLGEALSLAKTHGVPVFVLGRGSNLLVRDGGLRALVVSLAQPGFSRVERVDGGLRCGAGASLRQVALAARDAGMTGLEFLEGIPGSVGGGLRMNAGAMGGWMFDVVVTMRLMDSEGVIQEVTGTEAGAGAGGGATREPGDAGGDRGAAGREQPEAVDEPAEATQRRVHVQEPAGGASGWPVD